MVQDVGDGRDGRDAQMGDHDVLTPEEETKVKVGGGG